MFENLTVFSVSRFLYKKLMAAGGISNVVIVMVNHGYLEEEYRSDSNVKVFGSMQDLNEYRWGKRLDMLLRNDYFKKGSKLFAYVQNRALVAFTWLNEDFDPNGDVTLTGVQNYYIAGPTFVDRTYRGRHLSGLLKNQICAYAKRHARCPIYVVNSFDNIPIIKNNLKEGYRLRNVIIKQRKKSPIIL